MHNAPSVTYPVGRSRLVARLLLVFWAAGACCACVASYQFNSMSWRQAILAVSVLAAAWGALHVFRQTTEERLVFDGQHWSLSGAGLLRAAQATVVFDFQALMLVRLDEPGRRTQWLWPARSNQPDWWQDLRRAVYSRAAPAGNPADHPEAAITAAADVSSIVP
jgi:toxin CptA